MAHRDTFRRIAILTGLLAAFGVARPASADPMEFDAYVQLQQMPAYRSASALGQQMMEDIGITHESQLQQRSLNRGGFLGFLSTSRFGANTVGELLQKREAAAFKAARDAVGYSKQNAAFKDVFDRMLQGAKGRKIAHDYARMDNWEIDKSSLVTARMMAEIASGGEVGRMLAGGDTQVIDFNNNSGQNSGAGLSGRLPAVPFSPTTAGNIMIFPGSGGQTVRR